MKFISEQTHHSHWTNNWQCVSSVCQTFCRCLFSMGLTLQVYKQLNNLLRDIARQMHVSIWITHRSTRLL